MTKWELVAFPLKVVTRTYDCVGGGKMFMGHIEDRNGREVVRRDSPMGASDTGWEAVIAENTEVLKGVARVLNASAGVR